MLWVSSNTAACGKKQQQRQQRFFKMLLQRGSAISDAEKPETKLIYVENVF